jgi:hypothetical protein
LAEFVFTPVRLLFAAGSKRDSILVCNLKRDLPPSPQRAAKEAYFDRFNFRDFTAAILEKLRDPCPLERWRLSSRAPCRSEAAYE